MPSARRLVPLLLACFALAFDEPAAVAAPSITQQLSSSQLTVGQPATLTLTVQSNGRGSTPNGGVVLPTVSIKMPQVDGLQTSLSSTQISVTPDNATTTKETFTVTATHPGVFIIPSFNAYTRQGDVLRVDAMTLYATGSAVAAPSPQPPAVPSPAPTLSITGPVVIPSSNLTPPADNAAQASANSDGEANAGPNVPRDPDGGPAKVFIVITPAITDAYVGETVPMLIDFFIRDSVNADQNSLPTIKGSDFLMNNFTTRGAISTVLIEDQPYMRESWFTAIAAPKSGDFPLSMERDTYWQKTPNGADTNPFFASFFDRHPNLAHELIGSNLLTMHIRPLPDAGRPDNFTGAVGQFKASAEAAPVMVAVGEPVHLRFTVVGTGNFDYVRCPVLTGDPAWKAYVPMSQTNYVNEPHTQAVKFFDQSIIPQKNGNLPLPDASFSYFDPTQSRYVTVPLDLPVVTVTGSATPVAESEAGTPDGSIAVAATAADSNLFPNRTDAGFTLASLTPLYRHPWFWAVQTGLIALPFAAALSLLIGFRTKSREDEASRSRRGSLQHEEATMAAARERGDAVAFFLAARHAIQLQLGARWNLPPEAITLGGIRSHDPHLAETLEPLFRQADEVIYSGHDVPALDLAAWERHIRTELLQRQPAS